MTEQQGPNPYEPPSEEGALPQGGPSATTASDQVARYPSDAPKRAWELFRENLSNGGRINLVAAVVGMYAVGYILQMMPNLLQGQLGIRVWDPQAMQQSQQMSSEFASLAIGSQCMAAIILLAVGMFVYALARPLRKMHYEGPTSVTSLGDALSRAGSKIMPVLAVAILWGLMAGVGICLIIPYIVLIATIWVPCYLASTTELGVGDSISESFSLMKRQWKTIALLAVCTFFLTFGIMCPVYATIVIPFVGIVTFSIAMAVVWALMTPFWYTACMLTIEERDREIYDTYLWRDYSSTDDPQSPEHAAEW